MRVRPNPLILFFSNTPPFLLDENGRKRSFESTTQECRNTISMQREIILQPLDKTMASHAYHIEIANIVKKHVSEDPEQPVHFVPSNDCGGKHALPIYHIKDDRCGIEFANADLLIFKDGKVCAQFEIEEVDRSPKKLFGKILASAKCNYYEYREGGEGRINFSSAFQFVQIVKPLKAKDFDKSKKPEQYDNVKRDILALDLRTISGGRAIQYRLIHGTEEEIGGKLIEILKELLRRDVDGKTRVGSRSFSSI